MSDEPPAEAPGEPPAEPPAGGPPAIGDAMGADVDADPGAEPDAGPADADVDDGGSSIWDALTSTEPSRPLEQIEAPWDPERGGLTRIYRGVQKMTDVDGLPAGLEVGIGILEELSARSDGSSSGGGSGQDADVGDGVSPDVAQVKERRQA